LKIVMEAEKQQPSTRVLLVDDEHALRHALARHLRRDGYEVIEARSGAEALMLLDQHDVDVVVSDITMPDMGGLALLKRVREHDADVPFLLMTGMPEIASAVEAVKYGAFEYLTKPFDLRALSASVVRAIERRQSTLVRNRIVESARGSSPRGATGDIVTGTVLGGRYRIVGELGTGGMGTVYEAEREDLAHMPVAVKVLHSKFADSQDSLIRFRREAEVVEAIDHPNIVKIFDFVAVDDGPTFLVMELLRGATLAAAIEHDPPFSEQRVAFIASQVLSALGAAHAISVIHRDLKPENVMLTTISGLSDVVKLLDFGVAKFIDEQQNQKLTQTGLVVGTPAYMAPEYARGESAATSVGDIYAVGCVMYEALTGKTPFDGSNYHALLLAIQQTEAEPLRNLRPDVSPAFAAVVARAMAKDPNARFPTTSAMQGALAPWLTPS